MEKAHNNSMGWKVLGVFGVAFAVVWAGGAAWGVAATLLGRQLHFSDTTISTVSLLGIAFIRLVLWIPLTRLVLKRSLGEIAFRFHPSWWLDLLMGAGITVLAISVIFLVAVNAGWLLVEGRVWQSLSTDVYLGKLWVSLLINILVALMEEIIFRAYLLTGLIQAWGKSIGLGVMAVAFGLLHVPALEGSPPVTVVIALLFLTAFGLLFGWVYLRTGSLWMPIGIHFAWDFVENDLLNLSGDMTNPHVIGMATRLVGLPNLDGLENALLLDGLVLVFLAGLAWVWLTWLRPPTPALA